MNLILAPLRGVTIRTFRETFAAEIREAGFTEAVTPFIPAVSGFNPLKDRELQQPSSIFLTPQFIGKDPRALKIALARIKDAGFTTADLNCGCPFPMVRNKGRGSGLLKTPDLLRAMIEVGCEVLGEGRFSVKTRLGVERTDELLALMPLINEFPLRFLTIHARTAKEMYTGSCHWSEVDRLSAVSKVPIVLNGDLPLPPARSTAQLPPTASSLMIGRGFIRALGEREDSRELLLRYCETSRAELHGDTPVLGRLKELLAYWKDLPVWKAKWNILKFSRSIRELCDII